jgi:hypothetical protein
MLRYCVDLCDSSKVRIESLASIETHKMISLASFRLRFRGPQAVHLVFPMTLKEFINFETFIRLCL